MKTFLSPAFFLLTATACVAQTPAPPAQVRTAAVDSARLVEHVRFLASPELEGRVTGSAGNRAAREYVAARFGAAGLLPVGGDWYHEFALDGPVAGVMEGVNVLGMVRGTERPDHYLVVTAHYDHLGRQGNRIFHGADDNASGTGALIELGRYFAANPPRNSLIFAALDAEERGLQGARALVADPPVSIDSIELNVNLDMVSRNDDDELYAAGTYHYPFLLDLVRTVASRAAVEILTGHDRSDGSAGDDWTLLSDHGAFHAAGIPFLYFGVEDHPDYHRPTDTFERIDPAFYVRAISAVLDFIDLADSRLEEIENAAVRAAA